MPPFILPLPCLLLATVAFGAATRAAHADPSAPLDIAPDSAAVPTVAARLDTGRVHGEYLNGNFDDVIALLEAYRKDRPVHSRGDSLFIARHLGVVYAADPRTVASGRYWMHRLVVLSPAADLAGMYASESIERTFGQVKAEALASASARTSRRKWLWIGAGGTALAAATALVIIAARPEDPHRYLVPVDL